MDANPYEDMINLNLWNIGTALCFLWNNEFKIADVHYANVHLVRVTENDMTFSKLTVKYTFQLNKGEGKNQHVTLESDKVFATKEALLESL